MPQLFAVKEKDLIFNKHFTQEVEECIERVKKQSEINAIFIRGEIKRFKNQSFPELTKIKYQSFIDDHLSYNQEKIIREDENRTEKFLEQFQKSIKKKIKSSKLCPQSANRQETCSNQFDNFSKKSLAFSSMEPKRLEKLNENLEKLQKKLNN